MGIRIKELELSLNIYSGAEEMAPPVDNDKGLKILPVSVRVRPGAPKLVIKFYSCVNYLLFLEKKQGPLLQRIQKGYTFAVKDLKAML